MTAVPKLFRVTLEVSDLKTATHLYRQLFAVDGTRHPGARHYFDCDGVIVAVIDISQGGLTPTPDRSRCPSRSTTSTRSISGPLGSTCSRLARFTASRLAK
jgi:hypothetical protein